MFLRDLMLLFALMFIAPWRSRTRRHIQRLWHRYETPASPGPRVVVHAVSLGEVNAAGRFVRSMVDLGLNVICSTTTSSGRQQSRELHKDLVQIDWPLDISFCCKKWLDAVHPDVLVLVELEVWPTMIKLARERGIPVIVVNGRLSDRSFRKASQAKSVLRDGYGNLTHVYAQSDADLSRFRSMGVATQNSSSRPNLKWERDPLDHSALEALRDSLRLDPEKPVIVFGSSAPEEHELFASCFTDDVQIVVAPRRPEWFEHAFRIFPNARLRTDRDSVGPCVVLNTLGELESVYAISDLVVMGRSFGDRHGSDPMAPAAVGKPVLIGPNFDDFESAVKTLRDAGGLRVVSSQSLPGVVSDLMADPKGLAEIGNLAFNAAMSARGVAAELAQEIMHQTQPPRRDRGGAEEKEEGMHRNALNTSAIRRDHEQS